MMNAPFPMPQADQSAILNALAVLFQPDNVIEIRSFTKGRKRIDAGYFDGEHRQALAEHAVRLNKTGAAVYVTLNPIDPQLLSRYANRVEYGAPATTTDAQVTWRRRLLLDFDPTRPANTSATDAQLESAKAAARACYQALKAAGWPDPLVAESGNGFHLVYPLDLPNDSESRDLVKGVLVGLAARFDTDQVKLDQSVFNAGRIVKLYGTVATKGDHTPLAPWRLSRLVATPERRAVVTADQLRAWIPATTAKPPAQSASYQPGNSRAGAFDLGAFLSRLGIVSEQDTHEGSERFKLAHCPFNPEHGKGAAAIFRKAGGALGFKCQHNSCSGKVWEDVRALVDGPREQRQGPAVDLSGVLKQEQGTAGNDATDGAPASPSWPDPQPLPRLPKVPDFPLELLPDDLVDYVRDASERARFRSDFAAVASMAALGSVIGRKIGIRLKRRDDWTEYANVWAALIGPPAALKSPAERAAMRPFKKLQVAADDLHRQQRAEYDLKAEAFKLRKDAKRKKVVEALAKDYGAAVDLGDEELPAAPVARTYWTSEPTAEKLGVMLAENPQGLLVERDELSSLLVKLEDDRNATLRGLYLSGWSGNEGYRFDSISRGTTALPKFALSVVGGMQHGPLSRYVRSAYSGERADGLLQRFQLTAWPDPEPFALVDRFPSHDARTAADALFERADSFDPIAMGQTDGFGNDPPFVRLSDKAQGHFNEWYTTFMQNRRSIEASADESGPISAHFGKYPGLVGKLALIIHVADDPAGTEVSERTILKALAWIDYLTPHAQRVYHAAQHPETGAAELLLARMRRGELPDTFRAWEISRKGWHGLTDRDAVKKACRLLFEFGWLIEIREGGVSNGGRPCDPVYAASPAVKT